MKYLSTLFIASIIIGCSEETTECSLVKADKSIHIPIDANANSTTYNLRHFEQDGTEYLAVENMQSASISIYNLADCSHYKDVKPQVQGPNGLNDEMNGFDIVNLDTIVVTLSHGDGSKIAIIDSDANLIKKLKFEISYEPFFAPLSPLRSSLGGTVSMRDNVLFIPNDCPDNDDAFFNLHTQSIGYCHDFTNNKSYIDSLHLPDISSLRSEIVRRYYSICTNGKNRIVSFVGCHQIFVHDGTTWKYYDAHSRLMTKSLKGIKQSTIDHVKRQFVENPWYRCMIYDKYRDVYYRIVYLGYSLEPSDDPFTLAEFLPRISVMILDKEFNVIGETMLPENMYNINMFFVNKDGLWFSTNNVNNPTFDEDAINFDLFVLKR